MRFHSLLMAAATLTMALNVAVAIPEGYAAEAPRPARLEAVAGSDIPKVVLTEDAAKRLGIETVHVKQEAARRWKFAIGVVERAAAGVAAVAATGDATPTDVELWIRLLLEGEGGAPARDARLVIRHNKKQSGQSSDDDQTDLFDDIDFDDENDANDTGTAGDDDPGDDTKVTIVPIDTAPVAKRYHARAIKIAANLPAGKQYFEPLDADTGLMLGQRVLVHMVEPNSALTVTTVPYSSVIYTVDGGTWLFVATAPLEFRRHKIVIEQVLGDTVVLSEGPTADTTVVTVGAAELMGVEQLVGH